MTDGPHKSLPMNRACKLLADRAWGESYSPAEIAELAPRALVNDAEVGAIKMLKSSLQPDQQQALFGTASDKLRYCLRQIQQSFPGSAFVDRLLSEASRHLSKGINCLQSILESTLKGRYGAISSGITEHALRRAGSEAAARYEGRLSAASPSIDFTSVANRLINPQERIGRLNSTKKTGLDDGVELP